MGSFFITPLGVNPPPHQQPHGDLLTSRLTSNLLCNLNHIAIFPSSSLCSSHLSLSRCPSPAPLKHSPSAHWHHLHPYQGHVTVLYIFSSSLGIWAPGQWLCLAIQTVLPSLVNSVLSIIQFFCCIPSRSWHFCFIFPIHWCEHPMGFLITNIFAFSSVWILKCSSLTSLPLPHTSLPLSVIPSDLRKVSWDNNLHL